MPWFGIDIGGTLTKLVYFEPLDEALQTNYMNGDHASMDANGDSVSMETHFNDVLEGSNITCNGGSHYQHQHKKAKSEEETEKFSKAHLDADSPHKVRQRIHKYLVGSVAYGKSGVRDEHLEMVVSSFGGRQGLFHFIRFPTADMKAFLSLVRQKNLRSLAAGIYATGGGAYKFEKEFKKVLHFSFFFFSIFLLKMNNLTVNQINFFFISPIFTPNNTPINFQPFQLPLTTFFQTTNSFIPPTQKKPQIIYPPNSPTSPSPSPPPLTPQPSPFSQPTNLSLLPPQNSPTNPSFFPNSLTNPPPLPPKKPQEVNLNLYKFDEIDCLIQGVHFTYKQDPHSECYFYGNALDDHYSINSFDFSDPYPYMVVNIGGWGSK